MEHPSTTSNGGNCSMEQRVREATATTTEVSHSLTSPVRSLLGSSWPTCRRWQNASTPSRSAASVPKGQRSIWSSPFTNSRRSVENNICPCTLRLSTSPRFSTSLAETASSRSSPRLDAHQSCKAWLNPSTPTWRGQCSSTAASQSLSTYATVSSKAAFSPPYSLGSSTLPC